jgi:hypothetical protein
VARRKRSRRPVAPSAEPAPAAPDGRVRLELDLPHELLVPSPVPGLRRLVSWLREQEVEEEGSLLARAAELLHELAELGFRRVDHWEVEPGGWLPLPEAAHAGRFEPIEHLRRALRSPAWGYLAQARGFSVRLTADDGRRADARVLRLHREREHSLVIDLWGRPSAAAVRRTVERLRSRFLPLRVRVHR